ncbi:MAG TPA: hypothetical protein VNV62_20105 [Trebonia sp.]|jgi:hypothetical protein|nr:hypothetical protein [Trebonia sp.]
MANDLEDSRRWRDTIETRLDRVEVRVEEEARLRAAMDKDLSGVRVERNVLQALHDTQSEHTTLLREHTTLLRQHTTELREHTTLLREHTTLLREHTTLLRELDEKMRTGFERLQVGVNAILGLLRGDPDSGE